MDFIFGNNSVLKKEYEEMVKDLPKLNECDFCQKLHCSFCKKYTFNCRNCIKEKCKNCFKIKISKNFNNFSNQIISDFVRHFLFDYFKTSDLTNYFLKMDINFFVKEKMNVQIIHNFNEIKKTEEKQQKNKKVKYNKSKKHIDYFKFQFKKKWCLFFDSCFAYFSCSFVGMSVHDVDYLLNLTPVYLMIKVWEYSHLSHVNDFEPEVAKVFQTNLEKCIETLNQVYDTENYVCLESALLWFQFERHKLERLQARDEEFKEKLIESILKRDESVLLTTIFFPESYFFLEKIFAKTFN